jgi:O-antigen/teichoic acid export membrane protein
VLGLAYWTLAARKYSASVVGNSSAELSAIFLISGATSLGTNTLLMRYLPEAGNSARRLILGTYGASGGLAFLAALTVGLVDYGLLLPDRHAGPDALTIGAIALATALWSISSLQDTALIGMRAAKWVVPENAIYGVLKLALLGALVGVAPRGGIVVSWTAPLVPVILAITVLLFVRVIPRHIHSTASERAHRGVRELTRYAAGNWMGSLFLLVATTALPIMTVHLAGAHAAGYFYPPWSLMISLSLIAASLTVAMTVESARDGRQLSANGRRALSHIGKLLIPTVAVVVIAAPVILDIFGPAYRSHSTLVLRLLALSTLPNVVLALALAVARVRHRNLAVIGMQAAVCLLALGLARLLLPRYGINGAAVAWFAAQLAVALAVSPQLLRSLSRSAHPRSDSGGRGRRRRSEVTHEK